MSHSEEVLERLDVLGPYFATKIAGEQWAAIAIMTYGKGRILIGNVHDICLSINSSYCYHSVPEALAALEAWEGGEPAGWFRKL